ncbi:MarR family transcriptional regulator [Rhizobium subbaraonis]|uniref:MarR family transcriptional regulator n=1 Tax=Rhizobium subbaraonis TaxID=908946 RepID=A0A285V200_9HYPH|nr:MarR family transcriptional regulator [Rhizobium subbaraonis]SOC48089.1 MarR family transcriptional regulator [Rhizobium subbaraonis]
MNPSTVTAEFLESLTKASQKIRTAFNQQVSAHGLTYPRARTLFYLAKKQNITQSELASVLELEQATMVRLLDRMAENGLIKRQADVKDRRTNLIVLTPHGEEQAALVESIAADLRSQIFANIDPFELRCSIALLERISANVTELSDIHVPA